MARSYNAGAQTALVFFYPCVLEIFVIELVFDVIGERLPVSCFPIPAPSVAFTDFRAFTMKLKVDG